MIVLLVIGFIYRLILALMSEGRIYWDMENYHRIALDLLNGYLAADCCLKNNGYGVFLAGIYAIFGPDNLMAVRIIQVILDLLTALIIYLTVKNIFNKKTAFISFFIYIINPITSSYTGLRLPESLTLIIMALIYYTISLGKFKINKSLWFIFGSLLGLLLFVRMQYYLFVLGSIILLTIIYFRKLSRVFFLILSVLGLTLTSSYSLLANYRNYNVITLNAPYHSFYSGLYLSFFNTFRYPELSINFKNVNPEYTRVALGLFNTPLHQRRIFEKKSKIIFFDKFKTDYRLLLNNIARNMIWIWDKDHLFYYEDPFYPADIIPVRLSNILLLLLSCIGIIYLIKINKIKSFQNPVFVLTIFLVLYITGTFSIISNESRHSLASYGVIILWAGVGLESMLNIFLRKNIK